MTKGGFPLAACAGLALIVVAAPSFAAPLGGRLAVPAQVGTVDTVAGPGFCGGPARPDDGSMQVGDLAADAGGTLWFESGPIDSGVVTKVISSASVVVTGTGVDALGDRGRDGEGARPARLPAASRIAADGGGGLLIAASTAVLRLSEGLATVAGTRTPGETGREGAFGGSRPLRDARFAHIRAMATDGAGNVYVADEVDTALGVMAIRFLNRSDRPVTFYPGTAQELTVAAGTVDTIAGATGPGEPVRGPDVGGMAPALAVSGQRLYVSTTLPGSRSRAVVQVVNLGGDELSAHGARVAPAAMATVANVAAESRPSGGAVIPFASPLPGIAADDEGNLFLAELGSHRVRRVDGAGAVTTIAGTGVAGFNGNDRLATGARLDGPYDVAVGPGGRVYISDSGNGQVRVVDRAGTIRATLGNGATNRWACAQASTSAPSDGATGGASRGSPVSLAADGAGNVYVAAAGLAQVHRLAPSGSLAPVAGRPPGSCVDAAGCPVTDEAPPTAASLADITAVAPGPASGLYVLEHSRVRFLNLSRRPVEVQGVSVPPEAMRTVAGPHPSAAAPPQTTALTPEALRDRHAAATAGFHYTAMAGDPTGNLLVTEVPNGEVDRGNVQQVDRQGILTTLIDRPAQRRDGMSDTSRCCPGAADLLTNQAGNVYIADAITRRVWFLNRGLAPVVVHGVPVAPGVVEAVAGAGSGGTQDEGVPALQAQLSRPSGIAIDRSGNLYVADSSENSVHRVDAGGVMTTVVGTGQLGFNGDGLKGQLTALDRPNDLAVDACGNLLVADTGNDRVRRLNLVASCPTSAGGKAGGTGHPLAAVAVLVGVLALVAAAVTARLAARRFRRRDRHGAADSDSSATE